jgi:hypothetical protein
MRAWLAKDGTVRPVLDPLPRLDQAEALALLRDGRLRLTDDRAAAHAPRMGTEHVVEWLAGNEWRRAAVMVETWDTLRGELNA